MMFRSLFALGLTIGLMSTLATIAAIQTSSEDAEAQTTAYPLRHLCHNYYTGAISGTFAPTCPTGSRLLTLPDNYPLTLCASTYTGALRATRNDGSCAPLTIRIELPSEMQINVCYNYWTGALRIAVPYPRGSCGTYELLVGFPFETGDDGYRTLGNVDIDVPASEGILTNDIGAGLTVTSCNVTSANGGEVTATPDGAFTYTPPAPDPDAFSGTDSFDCTITDSSGLTQDVTIEIDVLDLAVWFVDADAGDPGDGRRVTPLNDIQALNDDGNDPDDPGDFIFLYEAAAQYTGGLVLEADQTLVGQEVSLGDALAAELGATSSLQGTPASMIPPFVVMPETDPTQDIPLLTSEVIAGLVMADSTTATGLTITSTLGRGVIASSAGDLLLDSVIVSGGVEGDGLPGVDIDDSALEITHSEIYGGNGGESNTFIGGSSLQGLSNFGADGGDGIVTFDSTLTVNASLVQGGHGADAIEFGGNGGFGITSDVPPGATSSSLLGINGNAEEIRVINSQIIGGNGGEGIGPSEGIGQSSTLLGEASLARGGNGGFGLFISNGLEPMSYESSRSLQGQGGAAVEAIVSNSMVTGGTGGNGVDIGGHGGRGINSEGVHLTVDQGSAVTGGVGGNALVGPSGFGGHGISTASAVDLSGQSSSLQGPGSPLIGSLTILDSSVTGGPAGVSPANASAIGGVGIIGAGAAQLSASESHTLTGGDPGSHLITVTNSTISGAPGVDIPGATGLQGGTGIAVEFADLMVTSGSVINGGDGGDGDTGAQGANGIDAVVTTVTVTDSTINGGAGGFSDNDVGPAGGDGISTHDCSFCFTLAVTGSDVNGGDGGGSLSMGAGQGGPGIAVFTDSFNISLSTITGGAPGIDGSGRGGPAGTPAIRMESDASAAYTAIIDTNTLIGSSGDPGQAPSLVIDVTNGSVCVDATGNTPTGSFVMTNADALAITQPNAATLSTDNNGVAVVLDPIGFNCSIAP